MARKAIVAKNNRKAALANKQRDIRKALRKEVRNINLSEEQRFEAQMKLQRLSKFGSDVQVRNRCELTGRGRGFLRTFRLSRIAFRELALKGMIPGVTKSSW
jgi:small subunit ribosomal protein S14